MLYWITSKADMERMALVDIYKATIGELEEAFQINLFVQDDMVKLYNKNISDRKINDNAVLVSLKDKNTKLKYKPHRPVSKKEEDLTSRIPIQAWEIEKASFHKVREINDALKEILKKADEAKVRLDQLKLIRDYEERIKNLNDTQNIILAELDKIKNNSGFDLEKLKLDNRNKMEEALHEKEKEYFQKITNITDLYKQLENSQAKMINEKQDIINLYEQKLTQHQDLVNKLTEDLNKSKNAADELEKDKTSNQDKINQARQDLYQKELALRQKQNELNELNTKLNSEQLKFTDYQNQISQQKNQIEKLKNELEKNKNTASVEIDKLNKANEAAAQTVRDLQQKINELNDKLYTAELKFTNEKQNLTINYTSETEAKQSQINILQNEINKIKTQTNQAVKDREWELNTEIDRLNKELIEDKGKYELEKQKLIKTYEQDKENLAKEKDNTIQKLRNNNQKITLDAKLNDESLNQKIHELNSKLKTKEALLTKNQDHFKEYQNYIQNIRSEIDQLKSDKQELEKVKKAGDDELFKLKNQQNLAALDATRKIQELEAKLKEKESTLDINTHMLDSQKTTIDIQTSEINWLKQELNTYKEQLEQLRLEKSNAQLEIESLKNTSAKKEKESIVKIEELNIELDNLVEQINKLKNQKQELETSNNSHAHEIEKLTGLIQNLENDLSNAQREKANLEAKLKELNEQEDPVARFWKDVKSYAKSTLTQSGRNFNPNPQTPLKQTPVLSNANLGLNVESLKKDPENFVFSKPPIDSINLETEEKQQQFQQKEEKVKTLKRQGKKPVNKTGFVAKLPVKDILKVGGSVLAGMGYYYFGGVEATASFLQNLLQQDIVIPAQKFLFPTVVSATSYCLTEVLEFGTKKLCKKSPHVKAKEDPTQPRKSDATQVLTILLNQNQNPDFLDDERSEDSIYDNVVTPTFDRKRENRTTEQTETTTVYKHEKRKKVR